MDSAETWNMLSDIYENQVSDNVLGWLPSLSSFPFHCDYSSGPSVFLGPNMLSAYSFNPTNLLITWGDLENLVLFYSYMLGFSKFGVDGSAFKDPWIPEICAKFCKQIQLFFREKNSTACINSP